jgi:RES domain-containing protein
LTPEDQRLDPEFLPSNQPLILYRLARARYANLSGVGAAFAPGRWNRHGQEAIYTSTEAGVPVLERLVHTPKDIVPSNLAMMKIRVNGDWQLDLRFMPRSASPAPHSGKQRLGRMITEPDSPGWFLFYQDLASAKKDFDEGDGAFAGSLAPFALAVPSVIVPVWNAVLYPQRRGFWEHVSLESVDAFAFDPRLFPEDAVMEPPDQEQAS